MQGLGNFKCMWEDVGILPPILNFGTRWMYVVTVTPRPLYLEEWNCGTHWTEGCVVTVTPRPLYLEEWNCGTHWTEGCVVTVTPRPLYLEEWNCGTHWTEGCVGPRAGLAALEKGKISSLYWKLNDSSWVVKLRPSLSTDWAVSTAILQWSCVHVEPVVLGAPNGFGLLLRNLLLPEHNSILTFCSLDLGNTACLNMMPALENRISIKIVLCCNFSGFRVTELQLVLSENFQNIHHFHVVSCDWECLLLQGCLFFRIFFFTLKAIFTHILNFIKYILVQWHVI